MNSDDSGTRPTLTDGLRTNIAPACANPDFPGSCLAPPVLPRDASGTTERLAYGIREAAELLGVSEKTIRRLIARGLLKPSRALRHLLIPNKEIVRFLDET